MNSIGRAYGCPFVGSIGETPPRLPAYPFVGVLPKLRRDPLKFFVNAAREFGDVVEMNLGADKALMVNRPEYVKHILQDNRLNYHKSKYVKMMKVVIGETLLTAEDQDWVKQRQVAIKGFQGCQLKQAVSSITDAAAEMIGRWRVKKLHGEPIDIAPEMMRVTLDAILRSMFGVRLDEEYEKFFVALTWSLRDMERRFWTFLPVPYWVPTPRNVQFRAHREVLDGFVYRIIEKRRKSSERKADLLQILIDAYADQEVSNTLLRDEVMTFVIAGHDTTANTLAWAWYLLSKNPVVARRLKHEVDIVLHGRIPTFDDLAELKYTNMVVQEVQRLYPAAWSFSRTAIGDDEIGHIKIVKGTTIIICPYAMHRLNKLWPNPEGFDPERFDPENPSKHHRFAYIPFGGGPRSCIGGRFAVTEMTIILAMVAQAIRLDLVPGQTVEPEAMIVLRPRANLFMHLGDA